MDNVSLVLSRIQDNDLVLDVGGWACPFNRANWILDAEPFETRGIYEKIGLPKSQGGDLEHFTKDTWVQRDICEKTPWPFQDKFFDFSVCSHTLEDIRDPLFVCSELIRVSKRGYIEIPSRIYESCKGIEPGSNIVGLSHHRWLIEIADSHVVFTMKYHMIHAHPNLSFPLSVAQKLTRSDTITWFFWDNNFTYSETSIHGLDNIYNCLKDYVAAVYRLNPQLTKLDS